MNDKFVHAPGPTSVRENVRLERAKVTTNLDVDKEFVEFYNTHEKIVYALNAIDKGLKDLGFKSDKKLVGLFNEYLEN